MEQLNTKLKRDEVQAVFTSLSKRMSDNKHIPLAPHEAQCLQRFQSLALASSVVAGVVVGAATFALLPRAGLPVISRLWRGVYASCTAVPAAHYVGVAQGAATAHLHTTHYDAGR